MRVRLPSGTPTRPISPPAPVEGVKARKWQFLKYGDDALLLCQQCPIKFERHCGFNKDVWFGWRIPARTVKLSESTINFNAGCNLYRAKLLKNIVRAQKNKALPTYKHISLPACYVPGISIELLVDGKSVANIKGNYKRGMIKDALKPYTTKARVGRKAITIPVGEADRDIAP